MVTSVVLFDLGNTLVQYYQRHEFPDILWEAITNVQDALKKEGLLRVDAEVMWQRVQDENYEATDHAVRPLTTRLTRIFQLEPHSARDPLVMELCRRFMRPIFARAHRYPDVLPVLRELRQRQVRTGIISNTSWGSPAVLWREELHRLDLKDMVDITVFCTDVGWRKPASHIFQYALQRLEVKPSDCVFVGDDPRWDLVGPRNLGMHAALIDRKGVIVDSEEEPIKNLYEIMSHPYLI